MLLRRWYDLIMDNKEELAKLITLEMVLLNTPNYEFCFVWSSITLATSVAESMM